MKTFTLRPRRRLTVVAAVVGTLGFLIPLPQAMADHATEASRTVTVPGTTVPVPVKFCLVVDGSPTCGPEQVTIEEATLTLTVSGPAAHGVAFAVDNQPDECDGQPGVAISVTRGAIGPGTASATLQGTGALGLIDASETVELANDPGNAKSVRTFACQNI